MKLTEKQEKLLKFVKQKHKGQVRKYTSEPYWNHPFAVARLVDSYNILLGAEIGLCHDLFEDTDCTYMELFKVLFEIGYDVYLCQVICSGVQELTDVFTVENFPDLNRAERKRLEATRMGNVSSLAANVKCCDIIDNTENIMDHDPKFGEVYIDEKVFLLSNISHAWINVYDRAFCCVHEWVEE